MTMLRAAALAVLFLASPTGVAALAQNLQTPQGATGQSAVEQRIQGLKLQLAITPQQEALWDAFAAKMRDNAAATERLAQQRSAAIATLNAVDNMRSYARISHEYAANADRLTAAFEGLYASLSPAQKQTADTLFRQEAAAGAGAPTR
jgi:hypothetical protein